MDLSINHKLSSLCCCHKPKERSLDTFLRALVEKDGGYIIIRSLLLCTISSVRKGGKEERLLLGSWWSMMISGNESSCQFEGVCAG